MGPIPTLATKVGEAHPLNQSGLSPEANFFRYDMNTKICPNCNKILLTSEFASHPTRGTQRYCKCCQRQISKDWYQANKHRQQQNVYRNTKSYVKAFNTWKSTLSCQLCGEDSTVCLDFHHVCGKDKNFNIASSVRSNGFAATIAELGKCICVCSNCHRKIHGNVIQLSNDIKTIDGNDIRNFIPT